MLLFTNGKWWGRKGVLGLKVGSALKEPLRVQLIYLFLLVRISRKNTDLANHLLLTYQNYFYFLRKAPLGLGRHRRVGWEAR